MNKEDLSGKTFNYLTVKNKSLNRQYGKISWDCVCKCGKELFVSGTHLVSGGVKSCGCLKAESCRKNGLIGGDKTRKYSPIEASAQRVWRNGYGQELAFDDFIKISQTNCHYCGTPPSNKYEYKFSNVVKNDAVFVYNGLDRKDSSKPHTADNVLPACWVCNRAKGDMDYDEFLIYLEKMISFRTK